ncbi:hypothetical protein [Slackia exigua]|uniref:hypothetical protein n=1 Tax=Slackia exigua TaxID=84109 RepID=UPI0028EAB116|nr:hypothetical protein [Slackia exigua]
MTNQTFNHEQGTSAQPTTPLVPSAEGADPATSSPTQPFDRFQANGAAQDGAAPFQPQAFHGDGWRNGPAAPGASYANGPANAPYVQQMPLDDNAPGQPLRELSGGQKFGWLVLGFFFGPFAALIAVLTGHANWKKARSQSITWSFVGFGIAVGLFLVTCLFAGLISAMLGPVPYDPGYYYGPGYGYGYGYGGPYDGDMLYDDDMLYDGEWY